MRWHCHFQRDVRTEASSASATGCNQSERRTMAACHDNRATPIIINHLILVIAEQPLQRHGNEEQNAQSSNGESKHLAGVNCLLAA